MYKRQFIEIRRECQFCKNILEICINSYRHLFPHENVTENCETITHKDPIMYLALTYSIIMF